jgi:diaminopimelate decarboxylase
VTFDPIKANRPPGFTYRKLKNGGESASTFHCEQISLERLAHRFGTPLYVYSAATIRERVDAFQKAFRRASHTICYSVKANSNLTILRLLARMGCGFDIVSGGELQRVLHVGRAAAGKVVFSGVGKTAEEMRDALRAGILLFNVESESELSLLAEIAAKEKKVARVAFRVNPNVPAETHPYISTGLHQHKFGVPIEQAPALYAIAAQAKYLKVAGVSVHIGSQITDMQPFTATMERVADLVLDMRKQGYDIKYVDAGGGLGISYKTSDASLNFPRYVKSYAQALLAPLRKLKVHLLLEPGRSIVASSGVLLTRVIYKKTNGLRIFLVVDAAMNDLIRPSLYGAYHEILPVRIDGVGDSEIVDVVGPICETGDFFARERPLPTVRENDLLALLDGGAYGMVLASNYNTRPRPAEVLVKDGSAKVIRRRETLADLIRFER